MRRTAWIAPLALLALAVGVSWNFGTSQDAPARVLARSAEAGSLEGFWWIQAGDQSSAVANFGPLIDSDTGLVRRWSLTLHLPGSSEPLTCLQGIAPEGDANPISARGENFFIELRPADNMTWGQLVDSKEIRAEVAGLF